MEVLQILDKLAVLEWLALHIRVFPIALDFHLLLQGQVCGNLIEEVILDLSRLDGLLHLGFLTLLQEHIVQVLQVLGESLFEVLLPIAEGHRLVELGLE